MALTPTTLNSPIDWTKPAFKTMLANLQGNILKGHGRDHTRNLFFKIDPAKKAQARAAIKRLASAITRADAQLIAAERFKAFGMSGGTSLFFFLSAKGYAALGIPASKMPADPRFRGGMKASAATLADPATASWDAHFRGDLHGMILIGDDCLPSLSSAEVRISSALALAGIAIVGTETGLAQHNKAGEGIEHFGYVDGRSQPLMLSAQVADEKAKAGGTFKWDPSIGPGKAALVADPGTTAVDAFGSYFIFRKLEQNVKGFKKREGELATKLGLTGPLEELAGGFVVGRFENGFPVINGSTTSGHPSPVDNNFNYSSGDPAGAKCPFASHIRKTNPRGETGDPNENLHLMPRRGITYGERTDDFESEANKPSKDVGLLFMAYNQDIGRQFEFTQASWANNPNFLRPLAQAGSPTGPDPVIGQGPPLPNEWPKVWNNPAAGSSSFTFGQFVTLKGGEYFFAPSIATLQAL